MIYLVGYENKYNGEMCLHSLEVTFTCGHNILAHTEIPHYILKPFVVDQSIKNAFIKSYLAIRWAIFHFYKMTNHNIVHTKYLLVLQCHQVHWNIIV